MDEISQKILQAKKWEKLFDYQSDAIKIINEEEHNIILRSVMNSGKSLIAAIACYKKYLDGYKILYGYSNKSDDKKKEFEEFYALFDKKPIMKNFGDRSGIDDADIIFGTHDQIWFYKNDLHKFNILYLDDVHSLYEKFRAIKIEKMIMFCHASEKIQVIGMTGTIEPLDMVCKWLHAIPIDIPEEKVEHRTKFVYKYIKKPKKDNDKYKILYDIHAKPVLCFNSYRSRVESRAKKLCDYMMKMIDYKNKNLLKDVKNIKKPELEHLSIDIELEKLNQCGIGIYHSGLEKSTKDWQLKLYNEGKLDYLFCTTSLSSGVNTPAKSGVFFEYTFWDPESKSGEMTVILFKQWKARIGRGMYQTAYIYMFCNNDEHEKKLKDEYENGIIEEVESTFCIDDYLNKTMLDMIKCYQGKLTKIDKFFSYSLANYGEIPEGYKDDFDYKESYVKKPIEHLINIGMVIKRGRGLYKLTSFGELVYDFAVNSYENHNLDVFHNLQCKLLEIKGKEITCADFIKTAIKSADSGGYSPIIIEQSNVEGTDIKSKADATTYALYKYWTNNIQIKEIESIGAWAVHIKGLAPKIAKYIAFAKELATECQLNIIGDIDTEIKRIKYGCTKNLLEIIKTPTIARELSIAIEQKIKEDIKTKREIDFTKTFENDIIDTMKLYKKDELTILLGSIKLIGEKRTEYILQKCGFETDKSIKNDIFNGTVHNSSKDNFKPEKPKPWYTTLKQERKEKEKLDSYLKNLDI